MSDPAKPVCVAPTACLYASSPVWSPSEGLLWWVDARRSKLHRFNPKTGNTRRYDLPVRAGCVALSQGRLLISGEREIGLFDPETEDYEPVYTISGDDDVTISAGEVANDGTYCFVTCDRERTRRSARFWHLYGRDSVHQIDVPPVVSTELLLISGDGETLYTSDSDEQELYAFDRKGEATRESFRVFATTGALRGYPQGGALDAEGGLWIAIHGAGRIAHFGPDGRLLGQVDLPVAQVTGCCFADRDLSTLYVTTARAGLTAALFDRQPLAGSLFALDVGTRGRAALDWRPAG